MGTQKHLALRAAGLVFAVAVLIGLPNLGIGQVSAAGVPYSVLTAGTVGMPATPQAFYPTSGFDVSMYHAQAGQQNYSVTGQLGAANTHADHGADCSAPAADNALPNSTNQHTVSTVTDSVYICHDHVMTALDDSGYAQITLMPGAVADWSGGTTSVKWAVSTFTASDRDWWELTLSPFLSHLQMPASEQGEQLNGEPQTMLQLQQCGAGLFGKPGQHGICGLLRVNGHDTVLANKGTTDESVLTPSRATRTTYEVDVSSTHVKVWLPQFNLVFIDTNVSIPFTQATMQLTHEAYDELKGDACGPPTDQRVLGGGCAPNTWHWSDISISNSLPLPIVHPARRFMNNANNSVNSWGVAAEAGSYLQFHWLGSNMQVSFDGGATYVKAVTQASELGSGGAWGNNQSFVPVPAGATGFKLKASPDGYGQPWLAADFSLLGPVGSSGGAEPTPTPVPPTPTPTNTPTGSPTPVNIENAPCMLIQNGQMVNGHCTGTFTPDN